jgi:hypothetical protein
MLSAKLAAHGCFRFFGHTSVSVCMVCQRDNWFRRAHISTVSTAPHVRSAVRLKPHQVRAKIGDGLPNAAVLRGRRWTVTGRLIYTRSS